MFKTNYSFNDVLLEPNYSTISSRKLIEIDSQLTKNIKLKMPFISSPMDTITEDRMAIAMALRGGLGIIHRYNTIEEQCQLVKNVKRYMGFIINDPYTINENETLKTLFEYIAQRKITTHLVIDNNDCFVGLITNRDIQSYLLRNN